MPCRIALIGDNCWWGTRQRTDKVHTGVFGKIWLDAEQPGLHTIMFSIREDGMFPMREGGFEFDRFPLTRKLDLMERKSTEEGPPASPKVTTSN